MPRRPIATVLPKFNCLSNSLPTECCISFTRQALTAQCLEIINHSVHVTPAWSDELAQLSGQLPVLTCGMMIEGRVPKRTTIRQPHTDDFETLFTTWIKGRRNIAGARKSYVFSTWRRLGHVNERYKIFASACPRRSTIRGLLVERVAARPEALHSHILSGF